ncbi:hypothetical protein Tco_0127862 [Tanacetum coccineum]
MCLEKDVIEISSDQNEGSRDWDSSKYKDTSRSGGKKEPKALVFHKIYTEEDSDRYIAQCFANGLYASDGEINLEKNENLILNDYADKLCLEYEVRKGKKLVKKELMVLLRGEINFVQFIINPEEDEFEPGLIFGRSFLSSANGMVNFGEGEYDHEAESSRAKRSRNVKTVEEALLPDVHHEFLEWRGCSKEAKSRYNSRLATLLLKLIYSPQIVDWQLLHKISCGDEIDKMLKISLKEAQTEEEVFFSVAWVRAFNIHEPIYPELCREFYATYEFDEVCANNELQSKKIISFRLGGHAHSLTLLEFARRLGLYHVDELEEEGFDTYFQGGLRSDKNFNAREY